MHKAKQICDEGTENCAASRHRHIFLRHDVSYLSRAAVGTKVACVQYGGCTHQNMLPLLQQIILEVDDIVKTLSFDLLQ